MFTLRNKQIGYLLWVSRVFSLVLLSLDFEGIKMRPVFLHHRSQWPSGLRRGSAADRLLELRVRIPPGVWMSVCCECCVLSGRGLCDVPIPCPEEAYRLWCVVVCDLETSRMRRPWPELGCCAREKKSCQAFYGQYRCCQ